MERVKGETVINLEDMPDSHFISIGGQTSGGRDAKKKYHGKNRNFTNKIIKQSYNLSPSFQIMIG